MPDDKTGFIAAQLLIMRGAHFFFYLMFHLCVLLIYLKMNVVDVLTPLPFLMKYNPWGYILLTEYSPFYTNSVFRSIH